MTNPIDQAMKEFDVLRHNANVASEQILELTKMNALVLAENDVLKREHAAAIKDRDLYRRYAERLNTRIDMITETIAAAKQESASFALEKSEPPPLPTPRGEPQPMQTPHLEGTQSLPQNQL